MVILTSGVTGCLISGVDGYLDQGSDWLLN